MKKSIFMQMHDGERPNEGSFCQGLQKLFYLADMSNRRKLVEAFPEFFGDEVPEFGINQESKAKFNFTDKHILKHRVEFAKAGLSDKKMNTHPHCMKCISPQNLEESMRDSAQMISCLSPLIYEILQKYQDNIQQDNNGQPSAFRLRLRFQKYDIEFSFSEFHEASYDAESLFDRL